MCYIKHIIILLLCHDIYYSPELTPTEKREALVDSFSSILWKTGDTQHAVITL